MTGDYDQFSLKYSNTKDICPNSLIFAPEFYLVPYICHPNQIDVMAFAPEEVIKSLKQGKYSPVYFLQGDEPYYIDHITSFIEKNALDESAKGFNQVVMYGKDVTISQVLNQAKRYPMMSDRQVVIVKEAQDIQDINKAEGQKLLESYIVNPLPSTILVLGYKYKTMDGRKSLGRQLDKLAVLVNSKKLYDNQLPEWIRGYFTEKGYGITVKATQMLADNIGNNLERLTNEIDKMLINFEEKLEVDAGMIQKYVGISKEYNVFELQRALGVKDVVKANRIINYFGANPKNNSIMGVIAILYSFYSKILMIHHAKDKSESSLARKIGLSPYFVKEYLLAARNYPLAKVVSSIRHLKNADLQAKGVGAANMPEIQILKELVYKLLH
ncbi:MAG: DNA polymerase III subunit delta [Candidatus Cyclobacteriaceae bacterium M3_2C_046]